MSENDIKHWFCFSYFGVNITSGVTSNASTYTGFNDRDITLDRINANKKHAHVDDNAVLISCSYLGKMSKSDFIRPII